MGLVLEAGNVESIWNQLLHPWPHVAWVVVLSVTGLIRWRYKEWVLRNSSERLRDSLKADFERMELAGRIGFPAHHAEYRIAKNLRAPMKLRDAFELRDQLVHALGELCVTQAAFMTTCITNLQIEHAALKTLTKPTNDLLTLLPKTHLHMNSALDALSAYKSSEFYAVANRMVSKTNRRYVDDFEPIARLRGAENDRSTKDTSHKSLEDD